MWFWLWIGILAGMIPLAGTIAIVSDANRKRREFDAELARYEPRHAVAEPPAGEPRPCRFPECIMKLTNSCADVYPRLHCAEYDADDLWATIFREPEPAPAADTGTLERLTATGELRAITDAWIAEHIGEGTP